MTSPPAKSLARPRAAPPRLPATVALGLGAPGWSVREGQVLGRSRLFRALLTVTTPPEPFTLVAGARELASRQGRKGKGW